MREITSLDIYFLVPELRNLINGRIQQVYQYGKTLRLEIFVSEKGIREIFFEPGKIFITNYKRKAPEHPDAFGMILRKHICGQKITDIKQHGFDRIIEIITENNILILEIFSKGNAILCDKSYNIIMPLEVQLWKDRRIVPKKPYVYPPVSVDPYVLNMHQLKAALNTNKELVRLLASDLGLSGMYAEEICTRANVNKSKYGDKIDDDELLRIYEALHSLKKSFEPQIILEEGKKIDVVPFLVKIYQNKENKTMENFSEALDEFYTEKSVEDARTEQTKQISKKMEKLQRILDKQKSDLEKWKAIEVESRQNAEKIYNHYNEVNELISRINEMRKTMKWNEIKEKLSKEKITVNEKKGIILI